MKRIRKKEFAGVNFNGQPSFTVYDYLNAPAGLSFQVVQDEYEQTAAISAWKLSVYLDWDRSTEYNDYLYDEYTGKTVADMKDAFAEIKKYYSMLDQNFDCARMRLIVFVPDLDYIYDFIRNDFECEFFRIKGEKMATCLLDNFIELRDVKLISGETVDTLDAFITKPYSSNAHKLALYGEFFYKNVVVYNKEPYIVKRNENEEGKKFTHYDEDYATGELPISMQQVVSTMMAQGMTAEDKALIPELMPKTEAAYRLIAEKCISGGLITSVKRGADVHDECIGHYDFVSAYGSKMLLSDEFPMTSYKQVDPKTINLSSGCYMIIATFKNFKCKFEKLGLSTITKEKVIDGENIIYMQVGKTKNRVSSADSIKLMLTNVTFRTVAKIYDYSDIVVHNAWTAEAGMLPEYVRYPVETAYIEKCKYAKDTPERAYAKAKMEIAYGVLVKGIYTKFENGKKKNWQKDIVANAIVSPYWGMYVLDLARESLIDIILELGDDFLYCHTDSAFFKNPYNHLDYINKYNKQVRARFVEYCIYDAVNPMLSTLVNGYMHDINDEDDYSDYEYKLRLNSYEHEALFVKMAQLGSFMPEHNKFIQHFAVSGPNNYVYKNEDTGLIESAIGGMPKHYVQKYIDKDGKEQKRKVNALIAFTKPEDVFTMYFNKNHKYLDYVDSKMVKNEKAKVVKDGHIYWTNSYRYCFRKKINLTQDDIIAQAAEREQARIDHEKELGKITLVF